MHAIGEALVVLSWYERPEDEIPPPEIWHHSERLEEWFDAAKARREDHLSGVEPDEEPEQVQNEAVSQFRR